MPKPSHGGFGQFFSHWYLCRNRYECVKSETCNEKYFEKKLNKKLKWFLKRLSWNNLLFRLESTPPVPIMWVFQPCESSMVIPNNLAVFAWIKFLENILDFLSFYPSHPHCYSPSFHQNTSPKWLTPSFLIARTLSSRVSQKAMHSVNFETQVYY